MCSAGLHSFKTLPRPGEGLSPFSGGKGSGNAYSLRVNIPETSLVPLINEQKGEKEAGRDDQEFS